MYLRPWQGGLSGYLSRKWDREDLKAISSVCNEVSLGRRFHKSGPTWINELSLVVWCLDEETTSGFGFTLIPSLGLV